MCRMRAKPMPPWMGRNAKTSRERMTPLTIRPSMHSSTRVLTAVCKTRTAPYLPFLRLRYQFRLSR